VSPIGGEGCTARRARCIEWPARASRDGDQHTLTANGGRFVVCLGRVFRKYRVRIVGRVWFRFVLDVDGASGTVVLIGVMFGKVVGSVGDAAAPVDHELALADAVADPLKTHVHGFGSFLFDRVVGDAGGSAVVGDDRGS
jgi:hypothetical protein